MKFADTVDVDFAYYWFVRIKKMIIDTASAVTLPIINQKGIKSLPIPLPPLNIQQKTVQYLDALSQKVAHLKQIQQEKMKQLEAIKTAILDRAFRGEL